MAVHYPNDADGDALRRLVEAGADLSRPMDIEYSVAVPSEAAGVEVASAADQRGYSSELVYDEEDDAWSVYCVKRMLATYEGVMAAQAEIGELSQPFGGECDGWGTFGNADD